VDAEDSGPVPVTVPAAAVTEGGAAAKKLRPRAAAPRSLASQAQAPEYYMADALSENVYTGETGATGYGHYAPARPWPRRDLEFWAHVFAEDAAPARRLILSSHDALFGRARPVSRPRVRPPPPSTSSTSSASSMSASPPSASPPALVYYSARGKPLSRRVRHADTGADADADDKTGAAHRPHTSWSLGWLVRRIRLKRICQPYERPVDHGRLLAPGWCTHVLGLTYLALAHVGAESGRAAAFAAYAPVYYTLMVRWAALVALTRPSFEMRPIFLVIAYMGCLGLEPRTRRDAAGFRWPILPVLPPHLPAVLPGASDRWRAACASTAMVQRMLQTRRLPTGTAGRKRRHSEMADAQLQLSLERSRAIAESFGEGARDSTTAAAMANHAGDKAHKNGIVGRLCLAPFAPSEPCTMLQAFDAIQALETAMQRASARPAWLWRWFNVDPEFSPGPGPNTA
jgi:hypothetical protein